MNESIPWLRLVDLATTAFPDPDFDPLTTPTGVRIETNAMGVGGMGGYCTCPDGNAYGAGDNNDKCGSLACIGGTPGECFEYAVSAKAFTLIGLTWWCNICICSMSYRE